MLYHLCDRFVDFCRRIACFLLPYYFYKINIFVITYITKCELLVACLTYQSKKKVLFFCQFIVTNGLVSLACRMGIFWEKVLPMRRKSTTPLICKNRRPKNKPWVTLRKTTIFRFARFGIFWEKVARYATRMRNGLCDPNSRGNTF